MVHEVVQPAAMGGEDVAQSAAMGVRLYNLLQGAVKMYNQLLGVVRMYNQLLGVVRLYVNYQTNNKIQVIIQKTIGISLRRYINMNTSIIH